MALIALGFRGLPFHDPFHRPGNASHGHRLGVCDPARGKAEGGNEGAAACLRALEGSDEPLDLGPPNGLVLPVSLCLNIGASKPWSPDRARCSATPAAPPCPWPVSIWRTRCSRNAGSVRTRSSTSTTPERWLLQTRGRYRFTTSCSNVWPGGFGLAASPNGVRYWMNSSNWLRTLTCTGQGAGQHLPPSLCDLRHSAAGPGHRARANG